MAYKSKFLHFKTKASYNAERAKTTAGTEERKVFDAYISFIDEGPMICTWGKEYKCDISASEVEALVDAGKISPATIAPLIAGTAAVGTSTKYAREDHRHPAQTTVSGNAGTATKLATPRVITVTGAVSGSATFDGSGDISINSTLNGFDASKITSGTLDANRLPDIPIEKLPAGALERMFVVESQTVAIDAVKEGTIQEGDVVQIGNGGLMYFCIDDTATTFENAFKEFTAGTATSVPWSGVTGKPETYSPTIGVTSTTAYAGDKGVLDRQILNSLELKQVSAVDVPLIQTNAVDLQFYINERASINNSFNKSILSHVRIPAATTTAAGVMTATDKTNLDTAYGWGNHASAGYAKTTQLANYLPLSGGTLTGTLTVPNITINGNNINEIVKNSDDPSLTWTEVGTDNKRIPTIAKLAYWNGAYKDTISNLQYCSSGEIASRTWVQGQGYLTSVPAQTWASITGKPTFATVATSGSYNDLTDKPTIPSAYTLPTASSTVLGGVKIGSGINISSGVISATYSSVGAAAASHTHTASQVTGLATVATSGSYNDLTNKPSIPSLSGYATQSWVTSQGYLTSIPTASTTVTGGIKLTGNAAEYLSGSGTFYQIDYSELSGTPDLSRYLTSIPVASTTSYGGIMVGYSTSGKNYAVQLSNGKAYVNVPWTDTNTTYSAGTNISISGTTINCTYSYTLPIATSSVLGGVKVGSNITLSSGTISLTSGNVTSALGYTPAKSSDIPEIPVALPNPYALTINGTSYTGSSAVSVTTSKPLTSGGNTSGTVVAGRNYNATSSSISSVSGFSYDNPDAVVGSSTKITSFPSSVRKMDGIADLSGSYYVYCFSYIGGYVYVNGAVYA